MRSSELRAQRLGLRTWVLAALLLAAIPRGASAEEPPGEAPAEYGRFERLALVTSGKRADGRLVDRRMTIHHTGVVEFETESGDEKCSSQAGYYVGKVDAMTVARFAKLASYVGVSPDPTQAERKGVSTLLEATWTGKTLTKRRGDPPNDEWQGLEYMLARMKADLRATRAIEMRVLPGKRKNKVEVEFRLLGEGPVSIEFPKDANQAFTVAEHPDWKLSYAFAGRAIRPIIALSRKTPALRISLKVKSPKQKANKAKTAAEKAAKKRGGKDKTQKIELTGEIRYSNDAFVHRDAHQWLRTMSLCAKR